MAAYVPQGSADGATTFGAMFKALEVARGALFSTEARLGAASHADIAVWFGPSRGWTWIENAPFPSPVVGIEWRDGCNHCGSLVHAACAADQKAFKPDPPTKFDRPAAPYQLRGSSPGYAPARRHISEEEMRELEAVAREHPERVRLARSGVPSAIDAMRAVRDELRAVERKEKTA